MTRTKLELLRIAFLVTCAFLAEGCTHVKPWERGKLAHPTMTSTGNPGPAEEHLYSIQEGAVGGGATATSGCGCN